MNLSFNPDARVDSREDEFTNNCGWENSDYFLRCAQERSLGLDILEALFQVRYPFFCWDKEFRSRRQRIRLRIKILNTSGASKEWAKGVLIEIFGKATPQKIALRMEGKKKFENSLKKFVEILDREFADSPTLTIFRRCRHRITGNVRVYIDTQR